MTNTPVSSPLVHAAGPMNAARLPSLRGRWVFVTGVDGLTRGLAKSLGAFRIRIDTVSPG